MAQDFILGANKGDKTLSKLLGFYLNTSTSTHLAGTPGIIVNLSLKRTLTESAVVQTRFPRWKSGFMIPAALQGEASMLDGVHLFQKVAYMRL